MIYVARKIFCGKRSNTFVNHCKTNLPTLKRYKVRHTVRKIDTEIIRIGCDISDISRESQVTLIQSVKQNYNKLV